MKQCSLFLGKNYTAKSVMITLLRKPVLRFISEWKRSNEAHHAEILRVCDLCFQFQGVFSFSPLLTFGFQKILMSLLVLGKKVG